MGGDVEQIHLLERLVCLLRLLSLKWKLLLKKKKENRFLSLFKIKIAMCEVTWFPPLFGLTNTSRGFMSCEGMGLTKKGFQRPSVTCGTEDGHHSYTCRVSGMLLCCMPLYLSTTGGSVTPTHPAKLSHRKSFESF